MSATTRTKQGGPATERHEGDYYRTPAWCVRAIFPWLPPGGMNHAYPVDELGLQA